MKHPFKPLATALAATLQLAAIAAVPVAWTNSPGMPPYPIKPVPHGSTVDLAVTLKGYTTPPIADGADVRLWYQTNGMGSAWWSAPATFDGSTITATFGPAQDCGADRVSLFFGAPSNVFASAVLRLTHAPGFSPSPLPLPVPALDFATVDVRNIGALTNGWSFGIATDLSPSTNYTDLVAAGKRDALDLGVRGKPTAENGGVFALDRDMHYTLRWRGTYWYSTHYSYEVHEGGHGFILYERHPVLLGGGGNGLVEICTFDLTQANCYAFSFTKDGERHEIVGYTNLVATLSQVQDALSTGTVYRAASVGTPTRWADATGCVWKVGLSDKWTVVHSPTLGWVNTFWGPEWQSDDAIVGNYYEGEGWYVASSTMTYERIGGMELSYWERTWTGNDGLTRHTVATRDPAVKMVGRVALTNDIPSTNALPDTVARAVYDVHDLKWDEEESILYWCRMVGGHDLCIAVTNVDLTHPTNSAALKAWREANR